MLNSAVLLGSIHKIDTFYNLFVSLVDRYDLLTNASTSATQTEEEWSGVPSGYLGLSESKFLVFLWISIGPGTDAINVAFHFFSVGVLKALLSVAWSTSHRIA